MGRQITLVFAGITSVQSVINFSMNSILTH